KGEPAVPWYASVASRSRGQTTAPFKSTASSPRPPNDTYTRSPSVTGVADAWPFLECVDPLRPSGANASHRRIPSERRNARTDSRLPSSAVVRITRSRQTIGEELPRPGTGVFQRTFWVADHVSGKVLPVTIPWPEGPPQRAQYRAPSPSTEIICTPAS